MNRKQAADLVCETFEKPFDRDRYALFVKNLLNTYEENTFKHSGNYIYSPFHDHINIFERIGKYTDGKKEIDLLIVHLKKESSIDRSRSMQRNFVAQYLNGSRDRKQKDAALVAYVSPDKDDWRFSLVKMEYKLDLTSPQTDATRQAGKTKSGKVKIIEEFTPAKRWSYLVGVNERSHTAQSRLVPIIENDAHNPTLKELEEAFNIEKVTDEFFFKYRELFIRTKEQLDKIISNNTLLKADFNKKSVNTVDFSKKLLGQIVFLYFLQKKGWFGVKRDEKWGSGSKFFLRELFEKKHGGFKNFFNDILEPLFYDALRNNRSHDDHYYSRFNCKIPFLNGGLFDPINNYDWIKTDILLPDSLFSNDKKLNEVDRGDGILDVFDRYNFTVKEDEPLEKEVAIDPELLGKAYEKFNAIRPDNFEEYKKALKSGKTGDENKFNKQYGVYYTPRDIVHYMCKESLVNYLSEELNSDIQKEDLEILVEQGEHLSEKEDLIVKREQETKKYSHIIPENIRKKAFKIDKILSSVKICDPAVGSGAFPVGMMGEIVKTRNALSPFIKDIERTVYIFKRECIENSLYGVDIDPGAVEIAKLRLWLSLVVDEDDIKNIKPLPNLDYKIVRGDSLLGIEKGIFNEELFIKLEDLKPLLFAETDPSRKKEYKEKISEIIQKLSQGHTEFDFEIYFSEVFHRTAARQTGKKNGFDIVIGNPPYIQLQKLRNNPVQEKYKKAGFEVHDSNGDIYCLFYEKGIKILKPGGFLCYITSNKWMRAAYGEKLRAFFSRHNPIELIDLGPGVFDSATVDTNILLLQKKNIKDYKDVKVKALSMKTAEITLEEQMKNFSHTLTGLSEKSWFIGSSAEKKLKEKIERLGKPLKDWDVKINYGIKTGLNEAFIIDQKTRDRLVEEDPKSAEILKPILRGRDIKRYSYKWAGLWLIATGFDIDIPKKYPSVYKHLLKYKEKAVKRDDQGHNWYNLRACAYYDEFEKVKIVWPRLTRIHKTGNEEFPRFSFVQKNIFVIDSMCFITAPFLNYLLANLNSSYGYKYFNENVAKLDTGGLQMRQQFVENFSIPPLTKDNKPTIKIIENLVDKILLAKKKNPCADTFSFEDEIDSLVYSLYDLTEEEIKIIEEGANFTK